MKTTHQDSKTVTETAQADLRDFHHIKVTLTVTGLINGYSIMRWRHQRRPEREREREVGGDEKGAAAQLK